MKNEIIPMQPIPQLSFKNYFVRELNPYFGRQPQDDQKYRPRVGGPKSQPSTGYVPTQKSTPQP